MKALYLYWCWQPEIRKQNIHKYLIFCFSSQSFVLKHSNFHATFSNLFICCEILGSVAARYWLLLEIIEGH